MQNPTATAGQCKPCKPARHATVTTRPARLRMRTNSVRHGAACHHRQLVQRAAQEHQLDERAEQGVEVGILPDGGACMAWACVGIAGMHVVAGCACGHWACMDAVTCTPPHSMQCRAACMRKHTAPINPTQQPTRKMMAANDVCSGSAIVQSTSPANMARACRHRRRG